MKFGPLTVITLFLLIYILPLGQRPLLIPDEHRYGEIPREMIASGDWIVPRLNGLRYFEKPAFGYWVHAASILAIGENPFAIRLPSAVAVGLTALLVFGLARRRLGLPASGLAVVIYLTSFEVFGVGTYGVLDSVLAFLITATLAAFWLALDSNAWRRSVWLVTAGVFAGLAFLTKGFLAFVLPAVVVVPYLVWQRAWRVFLKAPWLPLLAAGLVVAPWALAIHAREPDYWRYFFWEEHVRRFAASSAQHPSPMWYFVPVLLGGVLPWTVLAPAALAGWRRRLPDDLQRYALCWALGMFLFFSASRGKLGTYILPMYPALALLLAAGLSSYAEAGGRKLIVRGAWVLALLAGVGALALCITQCVPIGQVRAYEEGELATWLPVAAGLMAWAAGCGAAATARSFRGQMAWLAAAPLAVLLAAPFALPQKIEEATSPDALLERNLRRVTPQTILVTYDEPARAVCWFFRRSDAYVLHKADELAYGLGQADARRRFLTVAQFRGLVEGKGDRPLVLVSARRFFDQASPDLPRPVYEDHTRGFVFAQY